MTTKGFFFIPLRVCFFPTLVSKPMSVHTVTSALAHAAGRSVSEPSAAASPTTSTLGASQSCPLSFTITHQCPPFSPPNDAPCPPCRRQRHRCNGGGGDGCCGRGRDPRSRRRRFYRNARQGGKKQLSGRPEDYAPPPPPPVLPTSDVRRPRPLSPAAEWPHQPPVAPALGRCLRAPREPPQP